MKKLRLTLATFALALLTVTAFASEKNPAEAKKAFQNQIATYIGDELPSDVLNGQSFSTRLVLTVNNDGEIVVLSTNSKNSSFDSYIKNKLNYKKAKVKGIKKGELYVVPLTIKQS